MVAGAALVSISALGIDELLTLASRNTFPSGPTAQTTMQTTVGSVSHSSQAASTLQPPQGYVFVSTLGALASKSWAYFNHPTNGQSILVSVSGQWKAFSATCTHAPCTVGVIGSTISCPCHGGTFSPANGSVLGGPPPRPLPEYGVLVQNGDLYVSSAVVN